MESTTQPSIEGGNEANFLERHVKTEKSETPTPNPYTTSLFAPTSEDLGASFLSQSSLRETSNEIMPSTTQDKPLSGPKKKGTATVKKGPTKRSKGTGLKLAKKVKKAASGSTPTSTAPGSVAADSSDGEAEGESDNGPYCLCRGPDDHRWMIGCDQCEDWFHGDCVNLKKEIGENLVERFVCPNCTDGKVHFTRYKRTCSLENCIRPARVYSKTAATNGVTPQQQSVFCSDEHCYIWWERNIQSLPRRSSGKSSGLRDELTQEEFMALLQGNLDIARMGEQGTGLWKLATLNSSADSEGQGAKSLSSEEFWKGNGDTALTEEESQLLKRSAADRYSLAEEMVMCKKMLELLEMTNQRRRSAITAKRFSEDVCGYDSRLDAVGSLHAFVAWVTSEDGKAAFATDSLGPPIPTTRVTDGSMAAEASMEETTQAEDDILARGMCDKKRCKTHAGWYGIHTRNIRHQIKELTSQAKELLDRETAVKEAAEQRFYRRRAESNSVEVLSV
jgi:COMPASS component SPP1